VLEIGARCPARPVDDDRILGVGAAGVLGDHRRKRCGVFTPYPRRQLTLVGSVEAVPGRDLGDSQVPA
jgi:hypothetical protein